nr:hypothetical protein [uncultured bacterium]
MNISLKGFIPALTNINDGSSFKTKDEEGIILCSLDEKKSKNVLRISEEVIVAYF